MAHKTTNNNDIPMEALQLVPWYVTGCLSEDEHDYFQDQLKKYPALCKCLEEEQKLIELVHQDKTILELSILEPTETRLKKILGHLEDTSPEETSFLTTNTTPTHPGCCH